MSSKLVYTRYGGNVIWDEVDNIAFKASRQLEKEYGCIVIPISCVGPNEYWEEETLLEKGMISMKHTAVVCGLGQIGKSSLLLNPQYGNRLTIGAILTNMELESDELCKNICIRKCNVKLKLHTAAFFLNIAPLYLKT